jgi:hypothetical protein
MSFDPNVSNRLHRSGAIDFNVAFDSRHANTHKKRAPGFHRSYAHEADEDSFSACEGEPLYQVCTKRARFGGGVALTRKPIQLLSSLNGVGMLDEDYIIHHVQNYTGGTGGTQEAAAVYDSLRAHIFAKIKPNGVSVTKWDFRSDGKQGDLFVATMGGTNTVYVDEDVYAGDTLIVDVPLDEELRKKGLMERCTVDNPYGFIEWQSKRGVPKSKRTLVVRAMPISTELTPDECVRYKVGFYLRNQVLGQCTKGAKKGERCDLVLGKNAIGI